MVMLLRPTTPWFGWSKDGVHVLTFTSWKMAREAMNDGRVVSICEAFTREHACWMGNRAITRVCYGSRMRDEYGSVRK